MQVGEIQLKVQTISDNSFGKLYTSLNVTCTVVAEICPAMRCGSRIGLTVPLHARTGEELYTGSD